MFPRSEQWSSSKTRLQSVHGVAACVALLKISGQHEAKCKTILRWTLVAQAYKRIRVVVLSNQLAMAKCNIQLVDINQLPTGKLPTGMSLFLV